MDTNLTNIWKTVLGEIEIEVSRGSFLTLFKTTNLLSLENNVATIAAPSIILIDLLKKRFLGIIKKALDKATGQDTEIIFVPKSFPQQGKKQEKNGPLFDLDNKQAPAIGHLPRVRADFTFQTMAVSSSNQLAYVSAQTVAKNIGGAYNPLFIYGPVGVGKTHLMQAIANEVYQKNPARKIIYITSEEFTNEVVEAIRSNQTASMKRRFRTASLLVLDDVQFIAGKDKVQEELFHTFNILIDNGSQIILSSDRPPEEIKKLEKRLTSRFSGGLTVDIETPDFELRTAILLIKAKKYNVDLSMDIAKTIALKVQDSRALEGTLLRIITEVNRLETGMSNELVEQILNNKQAAVSSRLHPDDIIKNVCSFYDVKPTLVKGPKRDAYLVKARQTTMYLLKKELGMTYVEIGNLLGGRDHTTIMYGVEKVEKFLPINKILADDISRLNLVIHK